MATAVGRKATGVPPALAHSWRIVDHSRAGKHETSREYSSFFLAETEDRRPRFRVDSRVKLPYCQRARESFSVPLQTLITCASFDTSNSHAPFTWRHWLPKRQTDTSSPGSHQIHSMSQRPDQGKTTPAIAIMTYTIYASHVSILVGHSNLMNSLFWRRLKVKNLPPRSKERTTPSEVFRTTHSQ